MWYRICVNLVLLYLPSCSFSGLNWVFIRMWHESLDKLTQSYTATKIRGDNSFKEIKKDSMLDFHVAVMLTSIFRVCDAACWIHGHCQGAKMGRRKKKHDGKDLVVM